METAKKEEKENASGEGKKGKGKWGSRIYNFLACGGIMLVILGIAVIFIIISILTR